MPPARWLSRKAAQQQWLSTQGPKISAAAEWFSMLGGGHGMRAPAVLPGGVPRVFGGAAASLAGPSLRRGAVPAGAGGCPGQRGQLSLC